ncbi:MAG TPA: VWA domain-containing protein [Acidimicrobiales bacterium]|nr:VWA domain-containing protein [Acidimicrobiales bacterium]
MSTGFSADVYQNEFLADGATEVNAVVTVTAGPGASAAGAAPAKAVVLIVDTSGSMANPRTKIHAARRAAATACSMLPDGTLFALIAGSDGAVSVYPREGLAVADPGTRGLAAEMAGRLQGSGGTRISTWLDLARRLVEPHPDAIRLAYLLTDGENRENEGDFVSAIQQAVGVFQCDARGVGADWHVDELRQITSALLGEVDIIKEPDQMDDDFKAFLERAISKNVADVRIKLWAPKGATVRFVRQVAPTIEDLTGRGTPVDALTSEYATGAWAGEESRDYHVCVAVPPGHVGDEKLAARVSLMVGDEAVSQGLVRAVWTDDDALSTRINPQVAHYTGQAELAEAIQEGLQARKAGDLDTATIKLGRAVQLAAQSGNEGTLRVLRKIVDVQDEATGTVRVKRNVEKLDEMELDTRSTRTVQVKRGGDQ